MKTEVYIENYKADITADVAALVTFALDDVKDFSARSTSWSKTIVLPGTAVNNKLFGHIFETGQSNDYNSAAPNINYNFNASKSAFCLIFQNNIQAFKGVLRLLQINIDQGRIEYEVSVFGELAGLNVALSSGLLEDLDFSAYDVALGANNVVATWDNPGGSGVYFPLIDHGTYSTNKHDWDIRTFRPALYVKEYIDKMFSAANYRISSSLINTARFKGLIIPHNQKAITKQSSEYLNVNGTNTYTGSSSYNLEMPTVHTLGDFTTSDHVSYTYNGSGTASGFATLVGAFSYVKDVGQSIYISIRKNGAAIIDDSVDLDSTGGVKDVSLSTSLSLVNGDVLTVRLLDKDSGDVFEFGALDLNLKFASAIGNVVVPVSPGEVITINDCIPKNIRQIDFLLSIVKLFNLYVYEDRFDSKLIYMEPYVDFYPTESSGCVDWSYRLNRDKAIKVKPMSELNAKTYEFKLKQDSDYYNDLYRNRYGQGYGDYTYDSAFEFTDQKKSFELIFAGTPLVGYVGEDKVYSTIFKRTGSDASPTEETVDSALRILQAKKITGVTSWSIKDGATVLDSYTDYGYAGHLDDPDAPSNDLNFGAPAELFFTLAGGNLSNNQFNLYWSSYMAEITDKDAKLFSGWFYLTSKDIMELDFSRFVMVDGVLFRLNKVMDYNLGEPEDTQCELLKVNYLLY